MKKDANDSFEIKISQEAVEYIKLNGENAIIRYSKKG